MITSHLQPQCNHCVLIHVRVESVMNHILSTKRLTTFQLSSIGATPANQISVNNDTIMSCIKWGLTHISLAFINVKPSFVFFGNKLWSYYNGKVTEHACLSPLLKVAWKYAHEYRKFLESINFNNLGFTVFGPVNQIANIRPISVTQDDIVEWQFSYLIVLVGYNDQANQDLMIVRGVYGTHMWKFMEPICGIYTSKSIRL